jgi:hypothetical protein
MKIAAKRVERGEIKFASQIEAQRYAELLILEKEGQLAHLQAHPRFLLAETFTDEGGKVWPAIYYTADSIYDDLATGRTVVEDVKPASRVTETQVVRLRMALFARRYPSLCLRIEYRESARGRGRS